MQLRHAARYLGIDPNAEGSNLKAYNALQNDSIAIDFAAKNIQESERILKKKIGIHEAGFIHNMGIERYKDYIDQNYEGRKPNDRVPIRYKDYRQEIIDASYGRWEPEPIQETQIYGP